MHSHRQSSSMKNLADRIANLSPERRALLELRLKQNGRPADAAEQIIPRRTDGDPAPLSFAQQRLWFLDQLEPESPLYNIPCALRLEGTINVEALRAALDTIVARHAVLRTTMAAANGIPVQVVNELRPVNLPIIDLGNQPETQRRAELQRVLHAEITKPFDLSRDLMLRATLIRLAPAEHVLALVTHHIASDGWSSAVLSRELGALYEAFSTGKPSPLPELPVQYADYAVWQRQWLQGDILDTQLCYWKSRLSGISVLELPTDRPGSAARTYRGARQSLTFSQSLSDQLKALGRSEGVTFFMVLLAAFQTLLHRYTGQHDIAVGSPIAGRSRPEVDRLMGFFVNTLVLRSDLSGNPTFLELLAKVREVCLGAYSHQDLPFEKLVEELQPDRSLGSSPLFRVMFALQNTPDQSLELPGLVVNPVQVNSRTAKFDLTLFLRQETDGLRASLHYDTDLFDAATINRMLGHYRVLLEGIASTPEQRIADLPILTEGEKRQLVVDWDGTKTEFPKEKRIDELFAEQANRTPEAVAVVFGDRQLSYGQLDRRANQLARYLRKLGVGPDVPVGLCVERSLEMVVGMLGILKAGGAYVPVDPDYPKERLIAILEDTGTPVLITQRSLLDRLPHGQQQVVCIDTDWQTIGLESANKLNAVATGDHLAYVIYTSGSTGKPKGVAVCHRSVNRLVLNTNYIEIKPSDTLAQASTCSFDAATFEIWGALLNGARLVGVTTDTLLSPKAFSAQVEKQKINVMFLTTALFNQFAKEAADVFRNFHCLLFGGETADPGCVAKILQQGRPKRLLNVYGPTETTTFATWHEVRNVPQDAKALPIGRPIANTSVFILDANLKPVPIGVVGELYIGGAGVARGYLKRLDLTTEKFIEDPYSDEPGSRLYKTGDLARYLPDGNIEFVGRIDHQVKIRGYRIELGEVEAVLGWHPCVRQVVVVVQEDEAKGKRLVAYLVTDKEAGVTPQQMREFLREQLPDYMVPSAFVFLDTLPLTSNGKVDRRALPVPDDIRPDLKEIFVGPRTPAEKKIAEIWAEVLKLKQVGIHDNFFDHGGHSLLAVRVMSEIDKAFGKHLRLSALFQAPTVEKLAALLRHGGEGPNWKWLVPFQTVGFKLPFFLCHASGELGRKIDCGHAIYGVRPHGLDGKAVPLTVEEMASDYISEIRILQPAGPYLIGGYSFGGLLAFEVARQLQEHGQEVALLALLDPTSPRSGRFGSHLISSFSQEADTPVGNKSTSLGSLGMRGMAAYLRAGVEWRFQAVKTRAKILACQALLAVGRRVPEEQRLFYRLEMYGQAARRYIAAGAYSGLAVLLRTGKVAENGSFDWSGLISGELEVYEMPGSHLEAIQGRYLNDWAGRLRACLQNVTSASLSVPAFQSSTESAPFERPQSVDHLCQESISPGL
jgi:amino acid adenylation domain-containing protein